MNPILQALGQTSYTDLDRQRIGNLNWAEYGIESGYVMFITGRCGSTWLTHLIEDSGLCGAPHEFFSSDSMSYFNKSIQATSFPQYFETVLKKFCKGGRFGFQINVQNLPYLEELVDVTSLFPAGHRTYFWMTRQDILSQAYSFARAKKSGHWHSFEYDNKSYSIGAPNAELHLNDLSIWKEVLLLVSQERQFDAYAREHGLTFMPINYEQMVTDRSMVALNVLTSLGCDTETLGSYLLGAVNKTKRLDAGNKYQELIPLFDKYRDVIFRLNRERGSITWNDLCNHLINQNHFTREQLTS